MNRTNKVFDELLVLNAQRGDERAMSLLVSRWQDKITRQIFWRINNAEVAKDLTQDCWVTISRQIKKIQDPQKFGSWALRIANNKAIDWIRAQQMDRKREHAKEEAQRIFEEPAAGEEMMTTLRRAMRHLPEEQLMVLKMHYLQEMKLHEMSEVLHVPTGTVKSRLFKAREKLKEIINKTYNHEKG